jgi:RHS repeat-associated protein
VDHIDDGNLTTATFGYDGRGMIGSVQQKRAGGDVLAGRTYVRDSRDRITSFQKGINPGVNLMEDGRGDRFRYDEEGQLLEGWYNAVAPAISGAGNTRYDGFSYDALGNRGQSNYVANRGLTSFLRRDNGLNQYSSWSPAVIYHDDNSPWSGYNSFPGNGVTMAEGWLVASYNALNQPVAMVPYGWSDAVFFGYDPLGRCVKRWVGSSGDVYSNPATYFHYDGWNLLQEGNNAWGPSRVYVHGNRVDEIVWSYNTFTGEQAFHQYDARGHCTLLTDRSGNALEQYEYDAFGQPYFFDASGNSIGAVDAQGLWAGYSLFGNRFLFTGREWLSDLKVYDYRNRIYQPELGRFLQPDPKHFTAGDYNLYRYCHNDPVNRNDPMGLDAPVVIVKDPERKSPIESNLKELLKIPAFKQHFDKTKKDNDIRDAESPENKTIQRSPNTLKTNNTVPHFGLREILRDLFALLGRPTDYGVGATSFYNPLNRQRVSGGIVSQFSAWPTSWGK